MTRDEAVTRIQRILGFRSDKTTEIQDALQDAQVELEGGVTLPEFLKTTIYSATTSTTDERIKAPAGFIREVEDDALWYFDGDATDDEDKWTELAKDDLDFLRANLPGEGAPEAYALVNGDFYIFPTPDKAYTLKMIFYKEDTVLTTNIENGWLKHAHDLMIAVAGLKLASLLRPSAVAELEDMESQARIRLFLHDEANKHENRRYVMGGDN